MVQRYPPHPFDRKSRSTPEGAFFTALLGLLGGSLPFAPTGTAYFWLHTAHVPCRSNRSAANEKPAPVAVRSRRPASTAAQPSKSVMLPHTKQIKLACGVTLAS